MVELKKGFVSSFLTEFADVARRISEDDINKTIELLFEAWKQGSKIFIIGNGGSASTATHFACDLAKTTAVEGKKRFKVISLTDNVPLLTALTNDDGFASIFVEQLKNLLEKDDVLIAISVHGGSGQESSGVQPTGSGRGAGAEQGAEIGEIKPASAVTATWKSSASSGGQQLEIERQRCRCRRESWVGWR